MRFALRNEPVLPVPRFALLKGSAMSRPNRFVRLCDLTGSVCDASDVCAGTTSQPTRGNEREAAQLVRPSVPVQRRVLCRFQPLSALCLLRQSRTDFVTDYAREPRIEVCARMTSRRNMTLDFVVSNQFPQGVGKDRASPYLAQHSRNFFNPPSLTTVLLEWIHFEKTHQSKTL